MPVVLAGIALSVLWHRSRVNAVVGLLLLTVVVFMVERMLHTEYRMEGDRLTVVRGRFSRPTVVPLSDVTRIERVHRRWLAQHYILIEYGSGHQVSVQPQNEQSFLNEIKKRTQYHE